MDAQKQIQEHMYSLLCDGVLRFPNVSMNSKQKIHVDANPISTIKSDMFSCQRCALAKSRVRVVASEDIQKKSFFILSDFPRKEDEQSDQVFASGSPSSVLSNLVQKLGISQQSYFSFGLKCVPDKGIPQQGMVLCATHHLSFELEQVDPRVIFCFGHRALFSLAHLDPKLKETALFENQGLITFYLKNKPIDLFFLPSAGDLQSFPQWRTQVWKQLERFSTQKR